MPQRFEVWLTRLDIGDSHDLRPCVILGPASHGLIRVVALSASLDLFREGLDFMVAAAHQDFHATGLRRSSYAIQGSTAQVEMGEFVKRWGRLEGALARAFEEWLER
jgi:hypothetical protein